MSTTGANYYNGCQTSNVWRRNMSRSRESRPRGSRKQQTKITFAARARTLNSLQNFPMLQNHIFAILQDVTLKLGYLLTFSCSFRQCRQICDTCLISKLNLKNRGKAYFALGILDGGAFGDLFIAWFLGKRKLDSQKSLFT